MLLSIRLPTWIPCVAQIRVFYFMFFCAYKWQCLKKFVGVKILINLTKWYILS
uniref:Uncharacterized protein n=1 Tax=Rhizophora mucronata TaxID=61149 RepID=A0A2P2N5D7_RHIMU